MGIQGLLPQLKEIQNPVSLNRYSGQTLAIDGYAWLHRAACSCAYDLVLGNPTERYLQFFIKKFAMLKLYDIQPYLVFDGDSLPAKKSTELKRREKRIENKTIAERLWSSGERKNAMEYFQKCVDITPEMAKCIIDYCKLHGIRYIVAPFEADSQLVYLEHMNIVQGIISEDSDLLVFGCKRLLTKLNDFGECIEIARDDFNKLPRKFPLYELSNEQIITMVCLSGCDYTNGIAKIGLMKAVKLVQQHKTMEKILLSLQREGKLVVPVDFLKEYHQAMVAFRFQRVFCPISQQITSLNKLSDSFISSMSKLYQVEEIFFSLGLVIHKDTQEKQCVLYENEIDHVLHKMISRGERCPYDFKKLLINRERKLQLSSKSERLFNTSPVDRNKSIDSFFTKSQKNDLKSEVVKRPILMIPSVDKLTETIKKRKLGNNTSDIKTNSIKTMKSKFFSNEVVSQLTNENILTEFSKEVNVLSDEDDIETDLPESEIPTQIPSSFVLQRLEENTQTESFHEIGTASDGACDILRETEIEYSQKDKVNFDSSEFLNSGDRSGMNNEVGNTQIFIDTSFRNKSSAHQDPQEPFKITSTLSRSSSMLQQFRYSKTYSGKKFDINVNNENRISSGNQKTYEEELDIVTRTFRKPLTPAKLNKVTTMNLSSSNDILFEKEPRRLRPSFRTKLSNSSNQNMPIRVHSFEETESRQTGSVETKPNIGLRPSATKASHIKGKNIIIPSNNNSNSSRHATRSVSLLSQFIYRDGQ